MRLMSISKVQVSDGTEMPVHVSRPENKGRGAGILVLQEAFGVNAFIRGVCERLAKEGFVAAAPELFHRTAPAGWEGSHTDFEGARKHYEAVTEATLEADLRAAHQLLLSEAGVRKTASIGFCLGGRVSYLADAVLPLSAAVSFYGARIAPALLHRAKELNAPILLFWGGLDKHIPPEQRAAVAGALGEAGKPFANVEFSYADHAFFNEHRPQYHPKAAAEAWALTLAFLSSNGL
jgi:carboxymethylenebutenolidase